MSNASRVVMVMAISAFSLSLLSGCAARRAEARAKLPAVQNVCLAVDGVKETEKGLLLRKSKAILVEQGFSVADTDCDLKIVYTALDEGQWELLTSSIVGVRSSSSYRAEGLVSVFAKDGKAVNEDQQVNLRNYDSKVEILESLAWEIVGYVLEGYRPANPRKL